MFFKLKSNILLRFYESFGYITDNRNFGYELTGTDENHIGDKIISESGSVFLSVLDRTPQTIDELANKIKKQYADIDIRVIKKDAKEFYYMLEQEGFIVSGETLQECDGNDIRFSYKKFEPKIIKKRSSPTKILPQKSTQDFFEEYFNGRPQLTSLHIEITSKCNERCVHCYIPHERKVNEIEPELFFDVLEQCKSLRLLHLTLSGGEPMLHKNFCDFLRKCREYNFSVNVLSNLTLLTDEVLEEMKANPLLGVQVSLYSMNPNIHDKITQMVGSFDKTINAISKLIENDVPIQISCPILKQNKDSYKDVIDWAKENKIKVGDDYVILARYNNTTQNLCNRLSLKEIEDVIHEKIVHDPKYLEEMEREVEKKRNIPADDFVCSVCHSSICMTENGNVYPCAGWQDFVVGNVKETSLNDIWDNSKKVQYLRDIRKHDFPKCIQCPDKEFCTMCMVRNANENPKGDPLEVNEFSCKISNIIRTIMLEHKEKFINCL